MDDNLVFEVTDIKKKECVLGSVGNHYKDIDGVITIPAEVYGLNVVKVASYAFRWRENVKKIVLPNTIKEIESDAFAYCIYNHRTTKTNQKYPSVNL